MKTSIRKGRSGLKEAASFIGAFPLSPNDQPKIITVSQFDDWAVKEGFIPDMVERDTRNSDRNVLRNKINITAASPAWVETPANEPFHIGVSKWGESYRVIRTDDAYVVKAEGLPVQMESLLKTKKDALERLRSSVDIDRLSIGIQFGVKQLAQDIECFAESVDLACKQLNRKFHGIQQSIAQARLASTNGGIRAVLRVGDDSTADGGEQ